MLNQINAYEIDKTEQTEDIIAKVINLAKSNKKINLK